MTRFWRDRSIRFRPDRRRPDDWIDAHDRARSLAAERLSEPLGPADAAWLVEHLAACPTCQDVAAAYERQRAALRALLPPEPPRDLWARTAAALDREAAAGGLRRRGRAAGPPGSIGRSAFGRAIPFGAVAGFLVVAVVVGASMLARRAAPPVAGSPEASPAASLLLVTPFPISAGPIAWLERRDDGTYALALASVGQVCPGQTGAACPPITSPREVSLSLSGDPRVVVRSPKSDRLIVVVGGSSGGRVLVVPVPSPTPAPSPAATPAPTVGLSAAPTTSTPSATASATAVPLPSPTPTTTPSPNAPGPTSSPAAPSPSPTVSDHPSSPGEPTPSSPGEPPPSSEGSMKPVAILDGVSIVGQTAAWSPSGRWFAFSARPSSGLEGPNLYVWSPGESLAHQLTTDGRSVFAGWLGEWIVGSRIEDRTDRGAPDVVLGTGRPFLLDPASGEERSLDILDMWRPVVDPTGRWAVYWYGSLRLSEDGSVWLPDAGALVLGPWPVGLPPTAVLAASPGVSPSAEGDTVSSSRVTAGNRTLGVSRGHQFLEVDHDAPPSPTLTPPSPTSTASMGAVPSPSPLAPSPSPSGLDLPAGVTAITTAPIRDWDTRWDPTGRRFAVWLADPVDPSVGRLSLFTIDPQTGAIDPQGVTLRDEPALAGFSLEPGRLAWAVPPGQGGEPSHVRVLAWSGSDIGTAVSQPGPGTMPVIVVR